MKLKQCFVWSSRQTDASGCQRNALALAWRIMDARGKVLADTLLNISEPTQERLWVGLKAAFTQTIDDSLKLVQLEQRCGAENLCVSGEMLDAPFRRTAAKRRF